MKPGLRNRCCLTGSSGPLPALALALLTLVGCTNTDAESAVGSLSSLSLVDMRTGLIVVSNIGGGTTFNVPDLANKCLSVRANVGSETVRSVRFGLGTNAGFAVENAAPYDLMGVAGSRGCLKAGSYSVSATPYSESSMSGTAGATVSRSFSIVSPPPVSPSPSASPTPKPSPSPSASSPPEYIRRNLIREESFDEPLTSADYVSNSNFPIYYGEDFRYACLKSHSFGISTSVKRKGNSAARFEIRTTDREAGIVRSEAIGRTAENDRHRWYGLSIHLPSADWATSSNWNIITQFWAPNDPGENGKNPPIDLYVQNGKLFVIVRHTSKAIHTVNDDPSITKVTYDLGEVPKDQWLDFVWHIKYSYLSDGILELWMNGRKVISRFGPNSYNDQGIPYFKFGNYNYARDSRVLYVDEVRVGNGSATYQDVAP